MNEETGASAHGERNNTQVAYRGKGDQITENGHRLTAQDSPDNANYLLHINSQTFLIILFELSNFPDPSSDEALRLLNKTSSIFPSKH